MRTNAPAQESSPDPLHGTLLQRNPNAADSAALTPRGSAMTGKSLFLSTTPRLEENRDLVHEVQAGRHLNAVGLLLPLMCDATGLRMSALVGGTEAAGTICAIEDRIGLGLVAGSHLTLSPALASIPLSSQAPNLGPVLHAIESYVAVPILLPGGAHFGHLCVFDTKSFRFGAMKTLSVVEQFARLVEFQLAEALISAEEVASRQSERDEGVLREQFVAMLAHDLRNPLHAILANGNWLERQTDDPSMQQVAVRIQASARRMSTLIDDVLDFARVRMGAGFEVNIVNVPDTAARLSAVVEELRELAPTRHIVSDIRITHAVRCDIGRLQRVLSNLIGNALTHGYSTSLIRVSAHTQRDYLVLEVWNDCDPITPSNIEKIFQPFSRMSPPINHGGLGLGLYICSQIVREHGGMLTVSSTRENGTLFCVRLPLHDPPRFAAIAGAIVPV